MKLVCVVTFLYQIFYCYAGRQCLSCTGVESPESCDHLVTCQQSEVCFLHNYVTEQGSEKYDLGCSAKEACHHAVGAIFGRQVEGHHLKCTLCCNETNLCNQQLTCGKPVQPSSSLPLECSSINPTIKASGVYTIYPFGLAEHPRAVFCKYVSDKEIWTVFQRRYNGSLDFYRDWESYKNGFGSPYGEYWLGNDVLHAITSNENHELKVLLTDFDGHTKNAEYTTVTIGDERSGYRMAVFNFSGNAANCLSGRWNGMKFSTYDRDNDIDPSNCAVSFKGAWWYERCHCGNLNGQYLAGHHDSYANGVNWGDPYYSYKSTTMMVRKFSIRNV